MWVTNENISHKNREISPFAQLRKVKASSHFFNKPQRISKEGKTKQRTKDQEKETKKEQKNKRKHLLI
jgi:hypothetical protein